MRHEDKTIVLRDLDKPEFSDAGQAVLAEFAQWASGIALEPDAIEAAAVAAEGLHDFGGDDYREGLEVLCGALRDEAGLSAAGKTIAFSTLVRLARNRLRIEELVRLHPEVLEERIDRPVIVVGLVRTGTTHLVNLIASDPGIRCLRFWEALEPVPRSFQRGEVEIDERYNRAAESCGLIEALIPHMKAMHEMTPDHVHEECELTAMCFSSAIFEAYLGGPMPTYRDWVRGRDTTYAYRYMKKALQAMQWLRGGKRWVLKTPEHLERLRELHAVFPDATSVFTHRDPVMVTASYVTMAAYMSRMMLDRVQPKRIAEYWADRIEGFVRSCMANRDLLPAERSLDVLFNDFMANELGTVERVYAVADLPFTARSREAMECFMAAHRRGRHGTVKYSLEDLGLDTQERRRALQPYLDRFEVPR